MYKSLDAYETIKQHERLTAIGRSVIDSFDLQLIRTMESVRATASMISANDHLDQSEYEKFGASLIDDQSVLSLLEWQPVVPGTKRAEFEHRVSTQGQRTATPRVA